MNVLSKLDKAMRQESYEPTEEEKQEYLQIQHEENLPFLLAEYKSELEQAERNRQERHDKRLSHCMQMAIRGNRHIGDMERICFLCGFWRGGECENCLQRRVDFTQGRILETLYEKKMVQVRVSPAQSKKLTRKMKREQFTKLPQKHDDLLMFEEGALDIEKLEKLGLEPKELTLSEAHQMDWSEIVKQQPKGRNRSGSLIMPKNEEDEKFEMIKVKEIMSNAPARIEDAFIQEVYQETPDMDPKTPKQVERALNKRAYLFIKKLRSCDYTVYTQIKRVKCVNSRIQFNTYTKKDTFPTLN